MEWEEEKASNDRQHFDILLTNLYVHVVIWCNITTGHERSWFYGVQRGGFVGTPQAIALLGGIIIGVIMGGASASASPASAFMLKSSAFFVC